MPRPTLLAAVALATIGLVGSAVASPGTEAADAAPVATEQAPRPQLAVGVNMPLMWEHSKALSVSVGVGKHHAIRANIARYDNGGDTGVLIGDIFFDGDGSDAITYGRNVDVSVGYVLFPRKLWDGLFLEAAALVRDREKRVEDEYQSPEVVITDTKVFSARGLIGWSWLMYGHAFIQVGVGFALGHERGKETTSPTSYEYMYETHDVARSTVTGEAFMRFGGAFEL